MAVDRYAPLVEAEKPPLLLPNGRLWNDRAMAHIRLVEPEDASGALREDYDAAAQRAGKVFNIVKSMSLRPEVLRQSIGLYRVIMFGPSGLSRQERELLATVVSGANGCYY
jgi:alkylhydroperoxidase family enzyme